jgi:glycosyltransferase involved in cell wall biosynthesis
VGASLGVDVNRNGKAPGCNILFVGRDWQRKGGQVLVEAFRNIKNRIKEAQLTIIGCSPEVAQDGVTVLGPLDKSVLQQRRAVEDAYRKADVLCVPSDFEPFGICFVEAQFYGVIPVTFFGEGRAEAIQDGVTGVLVREKTAEALGESIVELFGDEQRIRQMSLAGEKFARENFTWDGVAGKILNVMEEQCC